MNHLLQLVLALIRLWTPWQSDASQPAAYNNLYLQQAQQG
jgi:hypothetical protein